jgi:hypothetical protein
VLILLLRPLVRMMRMLLSMLWLLLVRMFAVPLLVMVRCVLLVVSVLVVECLSASVPQVLVPELVEDLQMRVLSVVLVKSRVLLRCFLCPPLLLPLPLVAVLVPLLFVHCPFPGLRIRHHRIVIIAVFS